MLPLQMVSYLQRVAVQAQAEVLSEFIFSILWNWYIFEIKYYFPSYFIVEGKSSIPRVDFFLRWFVNSVLIFSIK